MKIKPAMKPESVQKTTPKVKRQVPQRDGLAKMAKDLSKRFMG